LARPFDVVVVVGSQGALPVFQSVLAGLPKAFPAAIVFDLHRRDSHGMTEELLERRGNLPVRPARAGCPLEDGVVYLAPSDRQLLVGDERRLSVVDAESQATGHRFADHLLTSSAWVFGSRMIAVVLSGRLHGGAAGVCAVKRRGGRVLVQDPDTAVAPSMPNAALATGCVDFALPPESLGKAMVTLCAATGAAELFRVRLNAGVRS
jgi:two-component system, chemotaxis family, protein-glutamate methylesterase/glutaminase